MKTLKNLFVNKISVNKFFFRIHKKKLIKILLKPNHRNLIINISQDFNQKKFENSK
jgi:hypothetical protein